MHTDHQAIAEEGAATDFTDLGCRAAMPPGGSLGEPVTKRKNLRWSAASSSVRISRKNLMAVLEAV